MCDARGNAVVVCSIENLDPMGVHTGDSWTIAPQQTLTDPAYQQLREAAFATARAVGVATGGANVQFAVQPGDERVPRDRDEPARVALLRARLEGDRLPDREARGAARGRLHARRAAERHHRQDDGRLRAGARLRRGQGAALRLREVPAGRAAPRRRDARGRRVARPRADVRRGVHEGDGRPRGAAGPRSRPTTPSWSRARRSRCRSAGTCCSRRRGAGSSRPGSTRTSPTVCARSRRASARSLRQAGAARGRLVRRRVRGADAVLLRHLRGRGRGAGAVGPRGGRARRGAEPDRAGDRVRLLLRPRRAGAPEARLRGGARQLEPRDGVDRLRHLRPALPRAARRAERARRVRARAARRRRRLVRRADAAAAGAGARGRGRAAARRPARRDRRRRGSRPLRAARGRPGAGVGDGRGRRRGARGRAPDRLPGARPAAPRARRARHARRSLCGRAARRRGRASSTATSRARSSSTSTRSATARTRGSRRCSSTSSRPAFTRATRPACLPGPSVSAALEVEIREVATRIARGLGARGLLNLQLAVAHGRLWVLEANPRASRTVPFVAKATGVPLVEHSVRLLLGEPLGALDLPERAVPTRAWAKEAVFPSERFPGAAYARARDALDRRGDGRRRHRRRGLPPRAPRRRALAPRRRDRPSLQAAGVS